MKAKRTDPRWQSVRLRTAGGMIDQLVRVICGHKCAVWCIDADDNYWGLVRHGPPWTWRILFCNAPVVCLVRAGVLEQHGDSIEYYRIKPEISLEQARNITAALYA
jgi:hypothetical protein